MEKMGALRTIYRAAQPMSFFSFSFFNLLWFYFNLCWSTGFLTGNGSAFFLLINGQFLLHKLSHILGSRQDWFLNIFFI
jgi:hypothetical protein